MDLPEALKKQKEQFLSSAPEETVAIMKGALENLSQSGILSDCLKIGADAPNFTLKDVDDTSVNLSTHLLGGPVILKFFRGDW